MNNPLVTELIGRLRAAKPERVIISDDEISLDARLFLTRVAECQHALRDIPSGSAVIVCGNRGPSYWADLLAAWGMGLTAVQFDSTADAKKLSQIMEITRPVCVTGHHATDTDTGPLRALRHIDVENLTDTDEYDIVCDAPASGLASIVFTSGSSGKVKGVELTPDGLLGNARATGAVLKMRCDDRLFTAIPYNFISMISHYLVSALASAELVAYERRLMPKEYVATINAVRPTAIGGGPLHMSWLAAMGREITSAPRFAMTSGDHIADNTIGAFQDALPDTQLVCAYGLTELSGRFCILDPALLPARRGSAGHPIEGLRVSIRGENGEELAPGETGEIWADGDWLMKGYHNDPESTDATLGPNGLRTGDVGYMDRDGFVFVLDRADDVFKCNGQKVSAVLVNDALMETGMFADVAVIGVTHKLLGTVPCALYVASGDKPFDKPAALKAVRAKLPSNHLPQVFHEVSAIPRTGSGKIKRAEIRMLAESAL